MRLRRIRCPICRAKTLPWNMQRHVEASERHHYRERCIQRQRDVERVAARMISVLRKNQEKDSNEH